MNQTIIPVIILSILLLVSIVTIVVLVTTDANCDDSTNNGGNGISTQSPSTLPPAVITTETLLYGNSVRLSRIDLETRNKKDNYAMQICHNIDNGVGSQREDLQTGAGCTVINALEQNYGDVLPGTCNQELSSEWIVEPENPANIDKLKGTPVQWVHGITFRHEPTSDRYLAENKGPVDCSTPTALPTVEGCCAENEMSASGVLRKTYDTTSISKGNANSFTWLCQPGPTFNFVTLTVNLPVITETLTEIEGFEPSNRAYITSGDVISLRNSSSGKYLTLCGPANLTVLCWSESFIPFEPPAPPYSNSTETRDIVTGDLAKITKNLTYFQSHDPYWLIEIIK